MPETLAEMRQFYWNDINNYYPPMHTILLSLVMQFGNAVHSYTLGFFLNLVLQLGMLLSAFAYGFTLMRRWQTPYKLRWAAHCHYLYCRIFPDGIHRGGEGYPVCGLRDLPGAAPL